EDLDDKIDVVFFPRTWKECRDMVQVDQVMLLWGKVQAKDDGVNIIADRVQTTVPDDKPAEDDKHSPVGNGHINGYGNGKGNGNGRSTPAPSPAYKSQPIRTEVVKETGSFMPPPPPNFDEEAEALPVNSGQLAVNSGQLTVNSEQPTATSQQPTANSQQLTANSQRVTETPKPAPSSQPTARPVFGSTPHGFAANTVKTIVVEIKPVGNWKEACRKVLEETSRYEGEDKLRLEMLTHGWSMDFPNLNTKICQDLLVNLRRLPGVAKVKAQ
ncbi:MAG: hypothetical protein R6X34_09985, partial [Chloroflexota bacterium]